MIEIKNISSPSSVLNGQFQAMKSSTMLYLNSCYRATPLQLSTLNISPSPMPPKCKGKKTKTPHESDQDGEHPGRRRKPMIRGAVAAHLTSLIPEYQRDVAGKRQGNGHTWFTNVTKDVCKQFGWSMFANVLLSLGVELQPKSGTCLRVVHHC